MKSGLGLLVLVSSLAVAVPALAQDEGFEEAGAEDSGAAAPAGALSSRSWYVSPMASYTMADKERGTDDGFGGVIGIGKKVTDGMALELTGFYTQLDAEDGDGSAKLTGAGVSALISPFNSLPNLYTVLSLATGSTKDAPGLITDYRETFFDIGLGYLLPISQRILLRAEARYRTDEHDRKEAGDDPSTQDKAFTDGVINLGLLFPLGTVAAPAPEAPAEVVEAAPVEAPVDTDGDGVADASDTCPDTPAGTAVGPDGCPLDSDGDGVPDAIDECPKSPPGSKVLANGCALQGDCRTPRAGEQVDENGCAVEQKFILKGVKFEFDSDRLTPEAMEILNEVAGTLQAYPDVKVELQGHTDSLGSDAYNQGLSERRAIAVKTYLSGREVAADRMTPAGYGESQPIDSNDTEEGRENNRRVELKVLE
ncbi:MAG TPA: OmpA family protein [Solimonas sp.]|nr:OmpA family protein [Solimonas sp.]